MAENTQPQQRLRMVNIIGPEGTVIASGVLISPNAEDVTVKNQVGQGTDVSANLKDFLFQKFSSTTETNDEDTVTIRTVGDGYFSIDPSKISILQSWSDYQNLNKKRLVGLYGKDENNNIIYIADFLSGIENLDPTLAQFETTDTGANITAVKNEYDFNGYTPVTGVDENDVLNEGQAVSAEAQAAEFMASFGNSSFWQQIIDREIDNKNRLLGLYDADGNVVGYFEPTAQNIEAIKSAYNLETNKEAYDLVIDLGKKSLYQHLVELNNFWQDLPFEEYNKDESGVNIATKYDIDGLSWVVIPTIDYSLDFSLSANGNLVVTRNKLTRQNVILPSTINGRPVTSIASDTFKEDSLLTGVWNSTVGNSQPIQIDEIGKQAFFECTALEWIRLNNVKKIGSQAFSGCTSLSSVSLDNIEIIKDRAFAGCVNLTEITIPGSCTTLQKYAFKGCTSLVSITIDNGIASIGESAFAYCDNLANVTIPDSVTSVGNSAFEGCKIAKATIPALAVSAIPQNDLKEVVITSGTIGISAFSYCSSLTSVTIGNNVTSIDNEAFRFCTSLTSVTIGNGVTSIGTYAFHNCSSLTSVTIGSGVTRIGELAFWKIGNEATIILLGTEPPMISSDTFYSDYLEKIIVPKGCKEKYIERTNWANLAEKIQEAVE